MTSQLPGSITSKTKPGISLSTQTQTLVIDVRELWAGYKRGDFDERKLLMGLGKAVLTVQLPDDVEASKTLVADMLTRLGSVSKGEAADAIEIFLSWADDHAIAVIDQAN